MRTFSTIPCGEKLRVTSRLWLNLKLPWLKWVELVSSNKWLHLVARLREVEAEVDKWRLKRNSPRSP